MATEHSLQDVFPLLPLRGLLVYPAMVLHFDVGRDKSIKALEKAMISEHLIVLASQEDGQMDEPAQEDLYHIGTLARVKQMMKLPNGTIRVLVEGLERAKIEEFTRREDWFEVRIHRFAEDDSLEVSAELQAMMRSLLQQFEQYVKLSKKVDQETYASVTDIDQPGRLADLVASHLPLKIKDKQDILEALDVRQRMEKVLQVLSDEREVLELERKIHQRVRKQMERTQKEYYLREQMKAIQKELGDREGRTAEIEELRNLMNEKSLPDAVSERVEREIDRLERIPAASAEGTVSRTYIDWLLALPCTESTESKVDLKKAERILDEEHYGLEKVKERILEFLAVQQLASRQMGPIICLAGPPGVGKTSLAKSIARSLNRPFVRVSLGGVRDEAEIRGHRRTYIGALPGRILQGMKQAGKRNPVFLLDEIDKMANDFRGDPSSALLEVLDPEQNHAFNDHYLEVDLDLSEVMWIATANSLNIPGPLLDRMEVIRIPGYTEDEKLGIAQKYLLSKQLKANGLKPEELSVTEEALRDIVRYYTRESGVRSLEREISKICRKVVKELTLSQVKKAKAKASPAKAGKAKAKPAGRVKVDSANLDQYLGVRRFDFGRKELQNEVGLVTGLAWTQVGGELLSIEASVVPGKGRLVNTGQLGDVMKESIQAALSVVRARVDQLGIDPEFHQKLDVHIHVPEGATPKDGPSAGIAMCTALVSVLTKVPVRSEVAMTGEITLRGRVLPIGGLKEKLLAAHRGGITTVIIPEDNKKDLADMPANITSSLEIHPVRWIDEVLDIALERPLRPNPAKDAPPAAVTGEPTEGHSLTH